MISNRGNIRALVLKLLAVSVGMFAFGIFAMPPLYEKFCEITGIGQAGVARVEQQGVKVDDLEASDRTVKLMFDATANSAIPWEFSPLERSKSITLGQPETSSYAVTSLADVHTVGRAVYNVTPPEAAPYFVKTECFCFSRQELEAGEYREMPVRFYINPKLPLSVNEITLSYTFFLNEDDEQTVAQARPSGIKPD